MSKQINIPSNNIFSPKKNIIDLKKTEIYLIIRHKSNNNVIILFFYLKC